MFFHFEFHIVRLYITSQFQNMHSSILVYIEDRAGIVIVEKTSASPSPQGSDSKVEETVHLLIRLISAVIL